MFRQKQVWIGGILALVSAATLISTHLWMSSRTFVALNKPISLARGNIDSGPFKINLQGYFAVEIDTGWASYYDPKCPSYGNVKARWKLYKDGAVLVEWSEAAYDIDLGGFEGSRGTYELNVAIQSDSSCLNPGHPRLRVYTSRTDYDFWASLVSWLAAFGLATGVCVAILGVLSSEVVPTDARISDEERVGQWFQWAQELPLKRPFQSMPSFALVAAQGLALLVFVMMVLEMPYPRYGHYVYLLKSGSLLGEGERFPEPLYACVASTDLRKPPIVYVNDVVVPWDQLSGALHDQLKIRPKWVVYVQGEPNVSWDAVVQVIDVAKKLHAKVVLVDLNGPRCSGEH